MLNQHMYLRRAGQENILSITSDLILKAVRMNIKKIISSLRILTEQ